MKDHDTSIQALGEEHVDAAIDVPQQLRLSYKGETSGTTDQAAQASSSKDEPLGQGATQEDIRREPPPVSAVISPEIYQHEPVTGEHTFRQEQLRQQRIREEQRRAQRRIDENLPVWLNPAIYAIMAALMYLLWRKFM
jgi:ubiquitin-conjugating enzyme E2 J1